MESFPLGLTVSGLKENGRLVGAVGFWLRGVKENVPMRALVKENP